MLNVSNPTNFLSLPDNLDNINDTETSSIIISNKNQSSNNVSYIPLIKITSDQYNWKQIRSKRSLSLKKPKFEDFKKSVILNIRPSKNLKNDVEHDSGLFSATEDHFEHNYIEQQQRVQSSKTTKFLEIENEKQDLSSTNRIGSSTSPSKYKPFNTIRKSLKSKIQKENLVNKKVYLSKENSSIKSNTRYEMPSLAEMNETKQEDSLMNNSFRISSENESLNQMQQNDLTQSARGGVLHDNLVSNSNLSVNQANDLLNGRTNILDYLVNNQKNMNTKLAIANIAALAAQSDLSDENFNLNSNNQMLLHNLIMDLMAPPIAVSSQFDLSSTASTDPVEVDISMIYHQQHQVTSESQTTNLNNTQISSSKQLELNQTFNNSLNSNFIGINNKKQINEQIMRTCMGYLDYINKKHTRERRLQTIRNKISGFVLLTLVFLMIFGLALVMAFWLTKIVTSTSSSKKYLSDTNEHDMKSLNSKSILNTMLQSEHMITKGNHMNRNQINRNNKTTDYQNYKQYLNNELNIFLKNLHQTLINKTNSGTNITIDDENNFRKYLYSQLITFFRLPNDPLALPQVYDALCQDESNNNNNNKNNEPVDESSTLYFKHAISEFN